MDLWTYLQDGCTNLNDKNKLDQFIDSCAHSLKFSTISQDDQKSTDPIMLQRLLHGSLINILTAYLRKLELPNGPTHPASRHAIDDTDDDSDEDQPSRAKFNALQ